MFDNNIQTSISTVNNEHLNFALSIISSKALPHTGDPEEGHRIMLNVLEEHSEIGLISDHHHFWSYH